VRTFHVPTVSICAHGLSFLYAVCPPSNGTIFETECRISQSHVAVR